MNLVFKNKRSSGWSSANLLAWYPLKDLSPFDISGKGNHGTPANIALNSGYGRNSPSNLFNGSSSKIDIPAVGWTAGSARSVLFWVRNRRVSSTPVMFSSGVVASGQLCELITGAAGTNELYFVGNGSDAYVDKALPPNVWTHVGMTLVTNKNNLHLYVNGIDRAWTSTGGTTNVATDANMSLGYRRASNSLFFPGDIVDVRIFGRVISASEVAAIYQEAFLPETEIPVLYAPPVGGLVQRHFRFRTDADAADATPTWGANEDAA